MAQVKRNNLWRLVGLGILGVGALIVALPLLGLAFYPQSRVLVPHLFGISCDENRICVEDERDREQAALMVRTAVNELTPIWGEWDSSPRVIFCITQECADTFGLGLAAGLTFGDTVSVIAPRGWELFYVKHELIHQWQAWAVGSFRVNKLPAWLREGMAYSLSEDPRRPLKGIGESHRIEFERRHAGWTAGSLLKAMEAEISKK